MILLSLEPNCSASSSYLTFLCPSVPSNQLVDTATDTDCSSFAFQVVVENCTVASVSFALECLYLLALLQESFLKSLLPLLSQVIHSLLLLWLFLSTVDLSSKAAFSADCQSWLHCCLFGKHFVSQAFCVEHYPFFADSKQLPVFFHRLHSSFRSCNLAHRHLGCNTVTVVAIWVL